MQAVEGAFGACLGVMTLINNNKFIFQVPRLRRSNALTVTVCCCCCTEPADVLRGRGRGWLHSDPAALRLGQQAGLLALHSPPASQEGARRRTTTHLSVCVCVCAYICVCECVHLHYIRSNVVLVSNSCIRHIERI